MPASNSAGKRSRPISAPFRALHAIAACILCAAIFLPATIAQAQSTSAASSNHTDDRNAQQILMLLRLDEYGRALRGVNQMLTGAPHDCRLLSLRGMSLEGLGQPDQALDSYKTALRFCPENPLALQNAAQIEYNRHQPDAVDFLHRLLTLNPKDQAAHAMLASIDRAKDECAQALPHFQASTRLFAGQPQYQQAYAFCLAKTGHNRQAAANYQQSLSANPAPDPALRYNLALVEYRLHKPAAALATLKPLLASSQNQSVLALGAELKRQATGKAGTQKPAPHFALMDEKAH